MQSTNAVPYFKHEIDNKRFELLFLWCVCQE